MTAAHWDRRSVGSMKPRYGLEPWPTRKSLLSTPIRPVGSEGRA